MKASELIELLQSKMPLHGDFEVVDGHWKSIEELSITLEGGSGRFIGRLLPASTRHYRVLDAYSSALKAAK